MGELLDLLTLDMKAMNNEFLKTVITLVAVDGLRGLTQWLYLFPSLEVIP